MKSFSLTAVCAVLVCVFSSMTLASNQADTLLVQIDTDIQKGRLSVPKGDNAIEKIWQFKAVAPYDQRINSRAFKVSEKYVNLAYQSISSKKLTRAQNHLDKAWMLNALTPGLETAQDALDIRVKAQQVAQAKAQQKALRLTAQRRAMEEAKALKRKAAEKERLLAKQRSEKKAKQQAQAKLAKLNAQRKLAAVSTLTKTKPIAQFEVDGNVLANRDTGTIRASLQPTCKAILDNKASVVVNTKTAQEYRWLTVRLTLCIRKMDNEFRLRHSHSVIAEGEPSISLHPGRKVSLLRAAHEG